MTNHCGTCRACCRALGVSELEKPEWQMCSYVDRAVGCQIYDRRPQGCRDYACIWLQSQSGASPLPAKLRPDRCGVVFDSLNAGPERTITARVPAGVVDRLEQPLVKAAITAMVSLGEKVVIRAGTRTSSPVGVTPADHPRAKNIIRGL